MYSDSDSDYEMERKRNRAEQRSSGRRSGRHSSSASNSAIQTRMYIDGRFVDSVSGKTFDVMNPATGELITRVAEGDKADVDIAVKAARRAFETNWKFTDGSARRDLMLKLADLLERNQEEIATLESLDNGKPYAESFNVVHPNRSASEKMFKSIFVIALFFAALHAATLDQEALRQATPKQQREMRNLMTARKSLMATKMRLEAAAPSLSEEMEAALSDLQGSREALEETKKACADGSSLCVSMRQTKTAAVKASERYRKAESAFKENSVELKETLSKLEDVRDTMLTLRTGYPKPSVPACPDGCRVICKHGRCWCWCPRKW